MPLPAANSLHHSRVRHSPPGSSPVERISEVSFAMSIETLLFLAAAVVWIYMFNAMAGRVFGMERDVQSMRTTLITMDEFIRRIDEEIAIQRAIRRNDHYAGVEAPKARRPTRN